MQFKILIAAFAICAAPDASAQNKSTYFVVDTSGSIKSTERVETTNKLAALKSKVAPGSSVSFTFIGGSCDKAVVIAPPVSADAPMPTVPVGSGGTPLGAALTAAIREASANTGSVVVVTDGAETCERSLNACDAAIAALTTYGDVPVSLEFVGKDSAAQDSLACMASVRQSALGRTVVAAPPVAPPATPAAPVDARSWKSESILWMLTIVLFVTAAIIFSFHYARASSRLEHAIKNYNPTPQTENDDANKSPPKAADVAQGTSQEKSPDAVGINLLGVALLVAGTLLFVAIAAIPIEPLQLAREEALKVLDTEFGSALFLAGALSFIASGASQYWRFLEARRQYYIVSNREQAEANARAARRQAEQEARDYRFKERTLENYQRLRSSIQNYNFPLYSLRVSLGLPYDNTTLAQLADRLVQLAVGPEHDVGTIRQLDVDRLSNFRGFSVSRRLDVFAATLIKETPSIPPATASKLLDLFYPPRERSSDESQSILSELLIEL